MNAEKQDLKESVFVTWLVVWLLLLLILLKGQFAFRLVGDPGQPTWDYGAVRDVPGQSPYAMYPLLPKPQHVRGKDGN